MASKGATKRLAAAPAGKPGRPAKKNKAAPDDVTVKCMQIANAMEESSLPDHVKEMLEAAVGGCLKTYKQDRHDYQNQLLDMAAEALEEARASCKSKVDAAQALVARCTEDKEVEVRRSALVEAERRMEEVRKELDEHKASQSADMEAVKVAIAERKAAIAAQKNGDKATEDIVSKKDKVLASVEALAEFKDKAAGAVSVKKFVKACVDSGLEKTLLEAVPGVLQKTPEARGTFGTLVLEQLETQLKKHIDSFAPALEESAPGRAERAAAVASAEEAVKAAEEKRDAGIAGVQEAQANVKAADIALAAARNAVEDSAPALQRAQKDLEVATAALKALEEGALADFAELLERAPPVAVAEAASEAVAEDKPMEAEEADEAGGEATKDSPAPEEGGA